MLGDQPYLVREDEAAAGPQRGRAPHDGNAGREAGLPDSGKAMGERA